MKEFELIEDYLRGKLQGQELKDFENKLACDSTFAAEVEDHRAMQDMVFTHGLLETREKLQAIRKTKIAKDGGKNGWYKGFKLMALALLAVTFVLVLLNKEKNSKNNKEESVSRKEIKPGKWKSDIDKYDENKTHPTKANPDNTAPEKNNSSHESSDIINEEKPFTTLAPDSHALKPKDQNPVAVQKMTPKVSPEAACSNVIIKAKIQTEESCQDKPTGKLHISEISGGKRPYLFYLDDNESSNSYFDHLNAGKHQIRIFDANGCISVMESNIISKPCQPDKSNIFAPEYGETWKFPITGAGNCKIRIYDAAGAMVYDVSTTNGLPSEWNGVGNNESYISAGAYVYQISCEDGGITQGSVTVTR